MKLPKRILSLLLCGVMLVSLVGLPARAEGEGGDTPASQGLCPHHTAHTADCGYRDAVAGTPLRP